MPGHTGIAAASRSHAGKLIRDLLARVSRLRNPARKGSEARADFLPEKFVPTVRKQISIETDLLEQVDAYSQLQGIDRSVLIDLALRAYLPRSLTAGLLPKAPRGPAKRIDAASRENIADIPQAALPGATQPARRNPAAQNGDARPFQHGAIHHM